MQLISIDYSIRKIRELRVHSLNLADEKYSLSFFIFECRSTFSQKNKDAKLIVGIVVDQMCYDYLYRYQANFCKTGFNRFLNQGMNIRNILYNFVPTYTGPGHASIYTGSIPADHGIVGNEWYDRKTSSIINCVTDTRESTVGSISTDGQRSPRNLKPIQLQIS